MKRSGVNRSGPGGAGKRSLIFQGSPGICRFSEKIFSEIGNDPDFCLFVMVWAEAYGKKNRMTGR